jgi:hypothetical protein
LLRDDFGMPFPVVSTACHRFASAAPSIKASRAVKVLNIIAIWLSLNFDLD